MANKKKVRPRRAKLGGLPRLGDRVKDRVTGFNGIVMAETNYLTGCRQVGVAPESLAKDGTYREWAWLDESRVDVMVRGVHPVTVTGTLEVAASGGPQPTPSSSRMMVVGKPARRF